MEQNGRRLTDRNYLAKAANSAVLTLASRLAVLALLGMLGWQGTRMVHAVDDVVERATELSKNVAVITAKLNGHEKRLDNLERRAYMP